MQIKIEKKGEIFKGKASQIVSKQLGSAMYESVQLVERNVKLLTPRGVSDARKGLLGSIRGSIINKGTPMIMGQVASNIGYVEVIEKGRAPGKKWPPDGVLIKWIQKKLGVWGKSSSMRMHKIMTPEKMAQSVEFIIRRKIGKRGFKGFHMFEKGLENSMSRLTLIFKEIGLGIAREFSE